MNHVWWFPWITLGCWTVAAGLPALRAWRDGDRVALFSGGLAAIIGTVIAVKWGAFSIPSRWITPLHEGFTEAAFAHAMGFQLSEDLSITNLRRWLDARPGGPYGIRAMLAVELSLQWGAGLLWWQAGRRSGLPPLLAALVGWVWWLPPIGWHMPLGLTGASHLLFLGGLVAWNLVEGQHSRTYASRAAPVAALAVTGPLMFVRQDAMLWGTGLVWLLTLANVPAARAWDNAARSWLRQRRPWRALGVALTVGAILLLLAVWTTSPSHPPDLGSIGWVFYVLRPPSLPGLELLPAIFAGLPLAAALVAVMGACISATRPLSWLAVPILISWAWQTQIYAAHGLPLGAGASLATFEAWRYFMTLSPLLAGLILLGAQSLRPRWRPGLAALFLIPPTPEALVLLRPVWPIQQVHWPRIFGLNSDLHRETSALIDLHQQGPAEERCWLVSRSLQWRMVEDPHERIWLLTAFKTRQGTRVYLDDLPPDLTPTEVVMQGIERMPWLEDSEPPCVTAWWSTDCRGRPDPGCETIATLPAAEPRVPVTGLPYVHPSHGPVSDEPAEIGAHTAPWPPPPTGR